MRSLWIVILIGFQRIRCSFASVNGIHVSGKRRRSSSSSSCPPSHRRRKSLISFRGPTGAMHRSSTTTTTTSWIGSNEYGLASTAPPMVVTTAPEHDLLLGPVGRTISGVVEIVITLATEYISGFMGGYVLGTLFGVPGFVVRPISNEFRLPLWKEFGGRAARMHGRSIKWACDWGVLSSVFGGSRSFVKVVRGGTQDEWNTIISSMMGGAILRRKDGPKAMLQGALFYGMITYVLSSSRRKDDVFLYEEETVEF